MARTVLVNREDERLAELGQLSVRLSPEEMSALGLSVGDPVRIETIRGRRTYGRTSEPLPEDAGRNSIRVGRWQRQGLKVRLYESVKVDRAELAPLERVTLHPAIHVTDFDFLDRSLKESLLHESAPLTVGTLLYFPVRVGGGGMAFSVLETVPDAGVFAEGTEFHVEWDAHGHGHGPGQGHGGDAATIEDVGGLQKTIHTVRLLVQLPLQFPEVYRALGITLPRGIILCGPPGVGKTLLARALASEIDAQFYTVDGPEIVGTMHGETETNLRKVFGRALAHSPAIVLIDEIDAIAPKRDQVDSQSDIRMVTTLLSLMDGLQKVDGVMVIGTTNRLNAIDVALRRPGRFDREVYIRPPDPASRLEILRVHTRGMPLSDDAIDALPGVAERTNGFVGADLMELCREAGLNSLLRLAEKDLLDSRRGVAHVSVGPEDFAHALRRVRPSALRETVVTRPTTRWEDIAGLERIKERLHSLIVAPLQHPSELRAIGVRTPRGVILHGPQGTGKTLLAHAAAQAAGVNLVCLNGPEIFSKWLGESEEAVRHVFQVARQLMPCIVYIDQLDAVAPKRSSVGESRTAERVVNQLLVELDAIDAAQEEQLVVVAATDRLDLIDPSVMRAGRLGSHVFVPLPDAGDRAAILEFYLQDSGVQAAEDRTRWLPELATATEGYSGADLRTLVDGARLRAFQRGAGRSALTLGDLREALDVIRPSEVAQSL